MYKVETTPPFYNLNTQNDVNDLCQTLLEETKKIEQYFTKITVQFQPNGQPLLILNGPILNSAQEISENWTQLIQLNTRVNQVYAQIQSKQFDTPEAWAKMTGSLYQTLQQANSLNSMITQAMQSKLVQTIQSISSKEGSNVLPTETDKTLAVSIPPVESTTDKCNRLTNKTTECLFSVLDLLQKNIDPTQDPNATYLDTIHKQVKILEAHAKELIPKLSEYGYTSGIYNHLHYIRKQASPSTSPSLSNTQYGIDAFFGRNGCNASNEERIYAVQRTLINHLLGQIQFGITYNLDEKISNELTTLERKQTHFYREDIFLSSNPAHWLFGKFYDYYKLQLQIYGNLPHPQNPVFKGDFGRHGWLNKEVPQNMKETVLQAAIDELEKAWRPK